MTRGLGWSPAEGVTRPDGVFGNDNVIVLGEGHLRALLDEFIGY